VRDVQRAAADLRVTSRGEERACEDDGCNSADEERRQLLVQIEAARRAANRHAINASSRGGVSEEQSGLAFSTIKLESSLR
jgi:hypothetical protein